MKQLKKKYRAILACWLLCQPLLAMPIGLNALGLGQAAPTTTCPNHRLPLAQFYQQHAGSQLRWQLTDQQIGWSESEAAWHLAELAEPSQELTVHYMQRAGGPVRALHWHDGQHNQFFWQLPDGWLSAAKLRNNQLEPLWQRRFLTNPSWLPVPLTMLAASDNPAGLSLPQEFGNSRRSAKLLVSGAAGQAVVMVDVADGRTYPIATPFSAGRAIANPIAFDSDFNGVIDRIYFVSEHQQVWRLQWQDTQQWQASLVAQLSDSIGVPDSALQGWSAIWPVSEQTVNQPSDRHVVNDPLMAWSLPSLSGPPALTAARPATTTLGLAGNMATRRGELLLMLLRQANGYALSVLKVADEQTDIIEVNTQNLQPELFWWYPLAERPVLLPQVLGSVLYMPLSNAAHCPFPQSYQQVLALNLFSGAAVYSQPKLMFRQAQTTALQIRAEQGGYSLGSAAEQLIPKVMLVEPQCGFCLQPMTEQSLQRRRWLAGYLAEEAF